MTHHLKKILILSIFLCGMLSESHGIFKKQTKSTDLNGICETAKQNLPHCDNAPWNEPDEFKRDANLFFNTLFPNSQKLSNQDKENRTEATKREFLKRLFLTLAYGPLNKTTDPQKPYPEWQEWPYALATALSHGQRVIIEIHGLKGAELLNLITMGNEKTRPTITKNRLAASHGFTYNKALDRIEEIKLKSAIQTIKNVKIGATGMAGLGGGHMGINIAFGGVGNKACMEGERIGNGGMIISNNGAQKGVQHGHLYLQYYDAPQSFPPYSALMIGLEGNESGAKNMFGTIHNAKSAVKDSRTEPSVTGGLKMACLLRDKAPHQYGGMRVQLKKENIEDLKKLFQTVLRMDEKKQKVIFREILKATGSQAKQIITRTMGQNSQDIPLPRLKPKRPISPPPNRIKPLRPTTQPGIAPQRPSSPPPAHKQKPSRPTLQPGY